MPAAELYAATGLQYAAVQHPLPARRGRRQPGWRRGRDAAADPRPAGVLADRGGGHRADQRLHHPADRPARPASWAHGLAGGSASTSSCSRRCAGRATSRPAAAGVLDGDRAAGRLPVTAVGSHDTASAVAAVPADGERFAYICSGTWSLVGRRAGRAGAHRGEPGGQLHQRGRRRRHGPLPAQHHGPVAAAGVQPRLGAGGEPSTWGRCSGGRREAPLRSVGGRRGLRRSSRPATCRRGSPSACRRTGQPVPENRAQIVRCMLDSLALAHRRGRSQDAQRLAGQEVDVMHIVGGGSRNALLCQLTADACGLRWWRGRSRPPRSATSWSRPGPTARSPAPSPTCEP